MKLKRNTIAMAAAACTLLITNAAQGAVMVTFREVTNNVVATWTGSLDPGAFENDLTISATSIQRDNGSLMVLDIAHPNVDRWHQGAHANFRLSGDPDSTTGGSYGFSGEYFFFSGLADGLANSTLVNFGNGSDYTMTWNNKTLTDMRIAEYTDRLVWTSSAGGTNTVRFTAIPEPSSCLFCLSGFLGLLCRRKR